MTDKEELNIIREVKKLLDIMDNDDRLHSTYVDVICSRAYGLGMSGGA
jgi:hypothetical protein